MGGAPVVSAPAVDSAPLAVGGSFFTRYEARAGDLPAIGDRQQFTNADAIFYRARMSFSPAPMELAPGLATTVYFEPQASGVYDQGGELSDVALNLHQGYIQVMAPFYTLQVGRFEMAYGDHLIIGNVPWHQTGRAFNGGRLQLTPIKNGPWVDVFVTLQDEGKIPGIDNSHVGALDHYLVGAYGGLGPLFGPFDFDVYALSKIWFGGPTSEEVEGVSASHTDPAMQLTLGARVKGARGDWDYRAEGGFQVGARKTASVVSEGFIAISDPVDVLAYQLDAEVGMRPQTGLRLALHVFLASGDDASTEDKAESWDQHFPTAHKFLGLTDVFQGRSNVMGFAGHAGYAVSPAIMTGVDGHVFTRPETPEGTDSYAGSELDFTASYKFGKKLVLRALYGLFLPNGDGMPSASVVTGDSGLQHYLEVELASTFP